MDYPKLFVCLPILNESENLGLLIKCLNNQSYSNFEIIACVNQLEEWWNTDEHIAKCQDNQLSIEILQRKYSFPVLILDKSSRNLGWNLKQKGVGWARKLSMDKAATLGSDADLILSIDADTEYPADYFRSVIEIFLKNPKTIGLSNPYYHKLTENKEINRHILRYEIYMRNYAINMLLIDNPYHFTALGSAMATSIESYKRVGGLSPKSSGEDFYFLQKLKKFGHLSHWNNTMAFPATRYSDRVNFGTGPALIKACKGDWTSYPIYHYSQFQNVQKTYALFPELYKKDLTTPMTDFLHYQLRNPNLWQALRNNYKTEIQFVSACKTQVDGLRILQYLKLNSSGEEKAQGFKLAENLAYFKNNSGNYDLNINSLTQNLDLRNYESLIEIREKLVKFEYYLRKNKANL